MLATRSIVRIQGSDGPVPASTAATPGTAASTFRARDRSSFASTSSCSSISCLPSPNRCASSAIVPCPISRPAEKIPIRSQTDLDLVQQVARQQDRHTAIADEPAQQVEDLGHAEGVDRRGRLVEDQDVRDP